MHPKVILYTMYFIFATSITLPTIQYRFAIRSISFLFIIQTHALDASVTNAVNFENLAI